MNAAARFQLFAVSAGIDSRILEIAIAGRRLGEHLARNAEPHFRYAEFKPGTCFESPAAVVRADTWFTARAFAALAARLFDQTAAETVLVGLPAGSVVAACLPAADARQLCADLESSASADAFERIKIRTAQCRTVDGAELDPESPPRIVANMLEAAVLERQISSERARAALLAGVRIRDPDRISIRGDLRCGVNVEIDVDVIIEGCVKLGDRVQIGAGCVINESIIGEDSKIHPYSIVDRAVVGSGSFVGPYGRLRPGAMIGDRAQIGNFVEIKQSQVGDGCRINHLAFVGDATLGSGVTIGAGVITCNHDGQGVQPTQIGPGAYVGSGTQLVAPLHVGENAVIGAGSTITQDVPAGKLTIARSRQVTIEKRPPPKSEENQK